LTATPPIEQFPSLALEGLIGPIIKRVFIKHLEGTVLAKPRIKLIELPERNIMRNYARYGEVYQKGVVENNALNSRVIHMIHELTSNEHDPRTCLVIVKRIEHGKILENLMRQKLPHLAGKFLFSETDSEQREIIREGLDAKKFWVAITTSIWKEGVDIPSLGAIINAAGGKDEIPNLQWLGRGMRKPAGKTDLLIVDFFDPSHHYLISHFGKRLCLYFKMGWMG
jgi:superfamily II DNA or RNA helicase